MHATTNGRGRKSLAEQIDRLDRTLDGLAEGLNEAAAAAVQEAVRTVLAELLADRQLRAQLQNGVDAPVAAPLPVAGPPMTSKLLDGCRRFWRGLVTRLSVIRRVLCGVAAQAGQRCRQRWDRLTTGCTGAWQRVRATVRIGWHGLRLLRHVAFALGMALAVGGVVGVAAYHAGPWLAATTTGICGFLTALAVRADAWLRRTFFPAFAETR